MNRDSLQQRIIEAIGRLGVREVARRLGIAAETVLRICVPGAGVHPGSMALAEKNSHKLAGPAGSAAR